MKLRIQSDSIRIRLGEKETRELVSNGRVEDVVVFGPEEKLRYSVEAVDADEILVVRGPGLISIQLPSADILGWPDNDTVGFGTVADNGEGGLHVLVEKDLPCEHPPNT